MRDPIEILWDAFCEARFPEEAEIIRNGILRLYYERKEEEATNEREERKSA